MNNLPELIKKLKPFLEKRGYFFNPDEEMTNALLEGLLVNQERYGYRFCPCRLATGEYLPDRDAVCPCDVRDRDIAEFGSCFCGLYVSQDVFMQKKEIASIPDRRNDPKPENRVWRCQVCGYVCARSEAPDVCPICGVAHDRFEPYQFA